MKRVVVTGIGLLTSIGQNYKTSWNNLLEGYSGVKTIKHFDTNDLPCKIAGHLIHDINNEYNYDRTIHLETKDIKRNDRFIQYGLAAAKMAIEDSGVNNLSIASLLSLLDLTELNPILFLDISTAPAFVVMISITLRKSTDFPLWSVSLP